MNIIFNKKKLLLLLFVEYYFKFFWCCPPSHRSRFRASHCRSQFTKFGFSQRHKIIQLFIRHTNKFILINSILLVYYMHTIKKKLKKKSFRSFESQNQTQFNQHFFNHCSYTT